MLVKLRFGELDIQKMLVKSRLFNGGPAESQRICLEISELSHDACIVKEVSLTGFVDPSCCRFWCPIWTSLGVRKRHRMATGIDFWGPWSAKRCQKLEFVFEGAFRCRQVLPGKGSLVP